MVKSTKISPFTVVVKNLVPEVRATSGSKIVPEVNVTSKRVIDYRDLQYFFKDYADSATISDIIDIIRTRDFDDSISLSDLEYIIVLNKVLFETVNPQENLAYDLNSFLADSAISTDLPSLGIQKVFSDIADAEDLVGVPDGLTYQFIKSKTENLTLTELIEYNLSKQFSDESVVNDLTQLITTKPFTENVSATTTRFVKFLSKPINEAQSVTEEFIKSFNKSVNDSLDLSDLFTRIVTYIRDFEEDLNADELKQISFNKPTSDSVTVGELFSIGALTELVYDDAFNVTEDLVKAINKELNENLTASELISYITTFNRDFVETASTSQAIQYALEQALADTANISELAAINLLRYALDTATVSDENTLLLGKNIFDTANAEDLLGVPDGITYQFIKTTVNTATTADEFDRTWIVVRSFADSASSTENAAKQFDKLLIDSASATQFIELVFGSSLTDSAIATESLTQLFGKALADSASTLDEAIRNIGKSLFDSASATESFDRLWTIARSLYDSASAVESLTAAVSKTLDDTFNADENIQREWTAIRSFADSSAISDLPEKLLARPVGNSITYDDTNTLDIGKNINDTLNQSETLSYNLSQYLTDIADAEDFVGIPDGLTYNASKTLGNTIFATEQSIISTGIVYQDSALMSDAGNLLHTSYFESDYTILSFIDPYHAVTLRSF